MGQVYLARTTGLGGFERHVVVKTLEVADEEEQFVSMFLDEARLVGALHHQYIAPIYEVGCDEEGRYFLVMDYIHGETAEAVWKRSREHGIEVPLGFALTTISATASALDFAHSLCAPDGTPLEIVHRDVSLSNVMIGYEGGVKLIDFGIAKSVNRTTRTQVGQLKGKFAYLAPEQVLRQPVDNRTDIFALGIVLYELTTMRRAFMRDSDLLTLEAITKGDLDLPSRVRADYPRGLETIVMKALALDPEQRYSDCGALVRDIVALARRLDITLGDEAITEHMRRLFDRPLPGNRRRLARSSDQVRLQPDAGVTAEVGDETPIDGMQHLDDETPLLRPGTPEPIGEESDKTVPVSAPHELLLATYPVVQRAPSETDSMRGTKHAYEWWMWFALGSVIVAVVAALVIGRL